MRAKCAELVLSDSLTMTRKGRLHGGPFCLLLAVLTACGGTAGRPVAPGSLAVVANPLELYRQYGLLAGSPAFPAIASFAALAGPADSAFVLVAASLPASALRFQREGDGFAASYRVSLTLTSADSSWRVERAWTERVRVTAFAETVRTDESIVFQRSVVIVPGRYVAHLAIMDANSARGFQATDTLHVRAFTLADVAPSAPLLAHVARGRTSDAAPPELILNPRHTVAYGAQAPLVYFEIHHPDAAAVALRVRDAADAVVWQTSIPIAADTTRLRHVAAEIPADRLPLGRLAIELDDGRHPPSRVPLFVTVSDHWIVGNFDEVLQFIAYVATSAELDSLRAADHAARASRWESFWERRDPFPATPANEFQEEFFARIRAATLQFSEPGGQPGWRTARGEVYIVLGPPDRVVEHYGGRNDRIAEPDAVEWTYDSAHTGRLTLLFIDHTGLRNYQLEPASLAAFRRAAERLKQER